MLQDRSGRIWMGTEGGGVTVWDGVEFTHYTTKEGLSHNYVRALLEDRKGRIWIGTHGGGVNILDGDKFIRYTEAQGLSNNVVYDLMQDSRERIWIATNGGVAVWDGTNFTRFSREEGLIGNAVRSLLEDSSGRIWMGTDKGLSIWDGTGFTQITEADGLTSSDIWSLLRDRQGRIWIGTHAEGVNVWDGDGFLYFSEEQGLKGNSGRSLLEDRAGNVWIGTYGGGANIWNPIGFSHFTKRDGLSGNNVTDLMEDRPGSVWIGTLASGANHWDGAGFAHFTTEEGLNSNSAWKFAKAENGSLWIGSYETGVNVWDGTGFTQFMQGHGLSSNNVYCILKSRSGHIWIGTLNGVNEWNGTEFIHYGEEQGLSIHYVVCLFEDSKSRIWIGTGGGGVTMWDGAGFTVFTKEEGLIGDSVYGLLEDDSGQIWIGTDEGISVWNGTGFRHYTEAEGLCDSHIRGFISDKNGSIWVGTANGLNHLSRLEGEKGWIVRHFLKPEGLSGVWIEKMMLDHEDRLWLGTPQGVSRLELKTLRPDTSRPGLAIQEVQPFFDFLDWRQVRCELEKGENPTTGEQQLPLARVAFDSILPFSNLPLDPVFPYNMNQLTLRWSGVQMSAPHKLQYSYLLEGKDRRWSPLVRENKITYQDLRPGSNTFKVRAVGGNGAWSDTASFTFTIRPPWWQTGWMYCLYGLVAILILTGIRQYELKHYLERAEARRLKDLDAVKTSLYTNITHEFRTPLTVILGMTEQMEHNPENWFREGLRLIRRNGRNLLRLVNQMLDLQKLEAGRMTMHFGQGDVIPFLGYLLESFHAVAEARDIELHYLPEAPELVMDYDAEKLQAIVTNLLSNAMKFTPPGGQVYLTARRVRGEGENQELEIRVRDTGPGIAAEHLPHIFDRFYQADDSATRHGEGTGIGLALTHELVQLLGGRIEATSTPGRGSEFRVNLPVHNEAAVVTDNRPSDALPTPETATEAPDWASVAPDGLPTVLIVEDNADVVAYLRACFGEQYRLEIAQNGREGIERAIESVPDLILSDVMMPEVDGFTLTRTLKEDERTSHIPIILLTAKADPASQREGFAMGADAYLVKPFDRETLGLRLRKMIELRRALRERYGANPFGPPPTKPETIRTPEERFLARLRELLHANLEDENFGIAQLCEQMRINRMQLHRKLTALTGMPASHFIRNFRLEQARELLDTTSLNISEISYQVGFRSPAYFTQSFTERFGLPPTDYRRSNGK